MHLSGGIFLASFTPHHATWVCFGHETCLASRLSWVLFFLRRLFLRFSRTWVFFLHDVLLLVLLVVVLLLTAVGFFPFRCLLLLLTASFSNTVVPKGSSEAAT